MSYDFYFDLDNVDEIKFVDSSRHEWQDFEVEAANYDKSKNYCCENGHVKCHEPMLYVSSLSHDTKNSKFELRGTWVMACGICRNPIFLDEETDHDA